MIVTLNSFVSKCPSWFHFTSKHRTTVPCQICCFSAMKEAKRIGPVDADEEGVRAEKLFE